MTQINKTLINKGAYFFKILPLVVREIILLQTDLFRINKFKSVS